MGMVRGDVAAFGRELAWRFAEALDGGLIGAYFVGSVALGGYVAGESDVDIVSVSEHQLPVGVKPRIADAGFRRAARSGPAAGRDRSHGCATRAPGRPRESFREAEGQ